MPPLLATCHYCGRSDEELRPYGPNGADVCYDCAMATPERRELADAAIRTRLDTIMTAGDTPVIQYGQPITGLRDLTRRGKA